MGDPRAGRVRRVVWLAYGVAGSLRRGCCNGFGSLPVGGAPESVRPYRVMLKVVLVQHDPSRGPIFSPLYHFSPFALTSSLLSRVDIHSNIWSFPLD